MIINKRKSIIPVKLLLIGVIVAVIVFFSYGIQTYNLAIAFRPIIRNVENKIVDYRTHRYRSVVTNHFIIRYDEGISEDVVAMVAKTAEDKYRHTVEIFEYDPQEKILLVLYDDPEALMRTTMLKKGSPPMGVYYGNTVHILNPIHWVKEQENLEASFYSEGPLLHELVHLFTDHLAKGNFPLWFTEGVSLYFEYRIDGYEWGKEVVFEAGEYSLEDLTNNFHGLNEYLAYTRSFRIINNFVQERGIDALMEIIKALGEGKNIEEFIHLF
ncbi:hypothetical protein SAMN05446037_101272 [Anaerovirgula multivorans]|uniref:Peptidase MA-like domain-containing protein n=1 Tax=Anaerovirgula multivorans TaxID=312168 RepID=A0A239FAR7_9FIRM|nr:hypothetical protein [Anaerovirgula multivorans]SNS53393.1 hypothetical protein SAMN05446037_101272 [Anaerovirgula multivorans]